MTERVLVTPRSMTSPPPRLDALRELGADVVLGPPGRQPTREELQQVLPGITAWIAGVETIDDDLLRFAPRLHTLARNGVGVDSIDTDAAARRGIRVLNTPGANADGVAELSIALLLALMRDLGAASTALRAGGWHRVTGRELGTATLGIVGLGAIGSRVAAIALGFGTEVLGFDPKVSPEAAGGAELTGLGDLLARSDAVSIHIPGAANGTPLITDDELAQMRAGSFLINTARWSVVDPDATLSALDAGHLGGYGLDVFAQEPPRPHRLLAHPRVLATPHLGAFTRESAARAAQAAIDNVAAALRAERVDADS
ncbi:MAG: phosphoglycerate dehydrogenase [Beutenbergiaceae bacterium]